MRHKFLGTGEAGYHPLRKVRTVISGLRYAVLYDWSVTYKLVASVVVLAVAFGARAWVDFLLILVVTAFVLVGRNLQQRDRGPLRFRRDAPQREDQGHQGHRRRRRRHCDPGLDHRARCRTEPPARTRLALRAGFTPAAS
jgi:hypothetical protein